MAELPPIIRSLEDIAPRYQAILCDVWGVVHNGERSFPAASSALALARERGLAVVLITNAPRPSADVIAQLKLLGVPDAAYDAIVTSGDVTRDLIADGPRRVYHLGPERDRTIYDGLEVELVEEFDASGVVCTGLFEDEVETPEDYAATLRRLRARDLPFICANPDIVVERGERLIWCAGALARDYALLGGRTLISGKPHRPIYEAALKMAGKALGRDVGVNDTLAIGDGMLTDVKGADDNGIDVLYVSGGIHAKEYGGVEKPDPNLLAAFLEAHGRQPVAIIPTLR
jgi:HAD superfamily hydrolase (TIGR01459 family)